MSAEYYTGKAKVSPKHYLLLSVSILYAIGFGILVFVLSSGGSNSVGKVF